MIFRARAIVIGLTLMVFGLMGWRIYIYFGDKRQPNIVVTGLIDNGSYSGDITCGVRSDKRGEIAVWLDGQPLVDKFMVRANGSEHPFTIPTKTITNGTHTLKIAIQDSTYHKNKSTQERVFNVDNVPLQATFVKTDGDLRVLQGRTLHIQFQANKQIKEAQVDILSRNYTCVPESKNSLVYECFVPIECEETPSEHMVTVDVTDRVGNSVRLENKFQVVHFPFKKEALTVSAEKVKLEQELGSRMAEFEQKIAEISQTSAQEKLWRGSFCTPIDCQKITCDFGTIRTTQHKGRYAHKALDLINLPRSVVWAPQDGIVVMKDRFDASGNTVVIDHGCGVLTLLFHLEEFAKISVGDKIAKGNPVGTLGKTGYATGYHLHWEHRVNNIPVDPMQWTKETF